MLRNCIGHGFRARGLASALFCAAWLVASPAWAQAAGAPAPAASPAKSPDSAAIGEIIVRGHAAKVPKSFDTAVRKFVHDMGRPGPIGQISRWRQPVCPITAGLTPAFDDFVNRRVRQVAARVDAPGPGDCREAANVMVIFTTKPDQLMVDVREHHEGLLGYHFVGQTKSLAAFEPPMKSWYVTVTTMPGGDFAMLDQAYAPGPPAGSGSRIQPEYRSEFAFVLVVIDANLLEGQAIGPIADRVAMLALSRPAPRDGCGSLPSILDLMDPKCPAGGSIQGLTAYDEAYLEALYAYRANEMRSMERKSIARRVEDETASPPSPGPAGQGGEAGAQPQGETSAP